MLTAGKTLRVRPVTRTNRARTVQNDARRSGLVTGLRTPTDPTMTGPTDGDSPRIGMV